MMSAYNLLNAVIQSKIQILKEEPYLEKLEANALIEHKKPTIDKAMQRIIAENPDYDIRYTAEINCVCLVIQSHK
ncbi:hypothetical protein GVX81_04350 [[Haemophilus] felis]|uniref:Uncharacterized protein n=1 Tax=[Haemophilus] felis TaxID=123822 RepID=A0A1T0AZ75_9PAST|nr:hypothetical protein [[Haemophilus] felis]NBI40647.1 hypothetical protein [[Haemophilus] felis]OOS03208.1 hypothetical protein B0188_06815 [[Haemophilus] felis]